MKFAFLVTIFAVVLSAFATGRSVNGELQNLSSRSAAQMYAGQCASCHGKDGRAKTMKSKLRYHARNLTDSEWQKKVSDERIFNSIMNGKGKMPAFGKKLSDQEIDLLVTYVRALKK
jgi:mono/diheme cytochrome c family protein